MKNQSLNRLEIIIRDYEQKIKCAFKPTRETYQALGVGQKRFAQLLKNQAVFNGDEMFRFASFFNVKPLEIFVETYLGSSSGLGERANAENQATLGDWITKEEAMKSLGIGNTTFCFLKKQNAFETSKMGKKVFVSKKSLLEYIHSCKQQSSNQ